MVRSSTRRASKYSKKIRGFVLPGQKKHFKSSVQEQVRIEQEVKKLVGSGMSPLNLPYYIIFAKELVGVKKKHSGDTALSEADLYLSKWQSRNLNTTILNTIKAYYFPGWAPPIVVPFRFNISLLDGPDQLV